jgi:hypothetical protein
MQIVNLKQIQQYYGTWLTLRGGCITEGQGKGRKPKTYLMRLMCSLYRNEYRNFKLAGATMGSRLWRSEEDWKKPINWSMGTTQGNSLCIFISN